MDINSFYKILSTAVEGEASDVHLKAGGPVIFRIHSELVIVNAPTPTKEWINEVVETIVPPHAKKRLEEEREVDFSYFHPEVGRFRTNVFQQKGEWCIAMRYVKTHVPPFEELGLLPILKTLAESPRGIVMVTGATGCGKSTTLAAMIQHINQTQQRHIITLEDPIEYVFEDDKCVIEQREVGLDTPSFSSGLRNVLRQDPDVIMIGEMRDPITVMSSISASETGHLVLSTLHTTTASQAIGRVLEFFPPHERDQVRRQLAGTLRAVVCQRMVTKEGGGVIPALEILINTPTVRKLLEEDKIEKLPAAIETGRDDGMQTFNQALYDLVKQGKVSEEEALRKATNPQALAMNFKGIFLDEARRILS